MPIRSAALLSAILALAAVPLLAQEKNSMPHDSTMMQHDSSMMKDAPAMSHDDHMMGHADAMGPTGAFTGAHGHRVSGSYMLIEQDGKQFIKLGPDFDLDGAPDPYVVLSATDKGSGNHTLNLGPLKQIKGSSLFEITAGTDLKPYKQVVIWCKKFNVTLAQAALATQDAMMHDEMKH